MSYKTLSEVPKKGISEQEIRIQKLLTELEIPHRTNQVYCFACRNLYSNPRGYQYPTECPICGVHFDEYGMYCLPANVLLNGDSRGVLYVNGQVHEKAKVLRRDKLQVRKFRAEGWPVFVLKNEEIDNMTNATLKATLYAFWRAVAHPDLYERLYRGEKEYLALA